MRRRGRATSGLLALCCLGVLSADSVAAYNGQATVQILITGPAAAVPCDAPVAIAATVISLASGNVIATQIVAWSLDSDDPGDALRADESITDDSGVATIDLDLGATPGRRTVVAAVTNVTSRVTVECAVGLPLTSLASSSVTSPGAAPMDAAGPVIGHVRIVRLAIDAAITDGDGAAVPTDSVAHLDRSAWPGDDAGIVVYGHARAGLFGDLWLARDGDIIELATRSGSARYRVVTVDPLVAWDDWSFVTAAPGERLYLQTCISDDPTAPRLVVTAVPVGDG